ncbi:class I tRNA ligase family protein, partial [candidate division WOR-3 bacterium]|nr:class I tRNA ligase family protein [candidate division WOR-3 bacterium]
EKTPDLTKFYPTDFLSTAPDIIFLWVARMIFSGLKFTGDIPFARVYFHSFILVESGERMSRSKGVGIDPVDMFQKYGADAVRFTLAYLESQSQSYRLSEKRFELGRNFTNKVWNACRLVATQIGTRSQGLGIRAGVPNPSPQSPAPGPSLQAEDKWIIGRYNRTVAAVTDGLDACAFSAVAAELYDFFWHGLCDWYLEFAKLRLKAHDPACRWTLYHVLRGTLQLLHPFMPFITEELWQRLGFGRAQGFEGSGVQAGVLSIMLSCWPEPMAIDESGSEQVETLRELIVAVRNIRAEMEVPAKVRVRCIVNSADPGLIAFLKKSEGLILELATVSALEFGDTRPEKSSVAVLSGCEVYVPLGGVVDVDKELGRMKKEIASLAKLVAGIDAKFANPDFAARARPEVVEAERTRRAEFAGKLARLRTRVEAWQ